MVELIEITFVLYAEAILAKNVDADWTRECNSLVSNEESRFISDNWKVKGRTTHLLTFHIMHTIDVNNNLYVISAIVN